MSQFFNTIAEFIIRWAGMPFSRLLILSVALLLMMITFSGILNKRMRLSSVVLSLGVCAVLTTIAVYPQITKLFIQIEYINRVRLAIGILSMVVLLITFEAVRITKMQERYALLWLTTGVVILIFALFPQIVHLFGRITGMEYVDTIVTVIITFLLLVAFHFSVAMSQFQNHESVIAQQQSILNSRIDVIERRLGIDPPACQGVTNICKYPHKDETQADPVSDYSETVIRQRVKVAFIVLAIGVVASAMAIGLSSPSPMIGDEVTHFYMLKTQIEKLPVPNFRAEIPMASGEIDHRMYPHVFLWHYLGAIAALISPLDFQAVQIYHLLFLFQLLFFGYKFSMFMAYDRPTAPLFFLFSCISIPTVIIFSIALYQDIPMAAQMVTVCYFIQKRRWIPATLFFCFALTLKATAVLFVPAFLIIIPIRGVRGQTWSARLIPTIVALACVSATIFVMDASLRRFGQTRYYPILKLQEMASLKWKQTNFHHPPKADIQSNAQIGKDWLSVFEKDMSSSYPENLRKIVIFFIYGGILLWAMAGLYLFVQVKQLYFRLFYKRSSKPAAMSNDEWWIWLLGGSFVVISYYFIRTAPNARFFLPGVILFLFPLAKRFAALPHKKIWLPLFASIALLQTGIVMKKVYTLRQVPPSIVEAIDFLENDLKPQRIFMYPEGNYRLFPVPHEWYFGHTLREFWRSDNGMRIKILQRFGVDAIVVKKHLVAEADPEFINLGIYPTAFVKDLRSDPRFTIAFENDGVVIFRVPQIAAAHQTVPAFLK